MKLHSILATPGLLVFAAYLSACSGADGRFEVAVKPLPVEPYDSPSAISSPQPVLDRPVGSLPDARSCLAPETVLRDLQYLCLDGTTRVGTLVPQAEATPPLVVASTPTPSPTTLPLATPVPTATPVVEIPPCSPLLRSGCHAGLGWTAVESAQLLPSAIRAGRTLGGVLGAYPSASVPLDGATTTPDLMSLASTASAGTFEFFDSTGTRATGAFTPNSGPCTADAQVGCVTTSAFKAANMAVAVDANIRFGTTIAGTGGALAPKPADCSATGETDCVAKTDYPATRKAHDIQRADFTGAAFDAAKWTLTPDAGAVADLAADTLRMTPPANCASCSGSTPNFTRLDANGLQDLTYGFFSAKVESTLSASTLSDTTLGLAFYADDGSTLLGNAWLFTSGSPIRLNFEYQPAGGASSSTNISYVAATHRYWRMRHDGTNGDFYFETSSDGVNYTVRRAIDFPFAHARKVKASSYVTMYGSIASPGVAEFDDVLLRYVGKAP